MVDKQGDSKEQSLRDPRSQLEILVSHPFNESWNSRLVFAFNSWAHTFEFLQSPSELVTGCIQLLIGDKSRGNKNQALGTSLA